MARINLWSSPGATRKFRLVLTSAIFPNASLLFNANEQISLVGVKVGVKVALGVKLAAIVAVGEGVQVELAVSVGVRVPVGTAVSVIVEVPVLVSVFVETSVGRKIRGVGDISTCGLGRKNKSIKMITSMAAITNLNISYACQCL